MVVLSELKKSVDKLTEQIAADRQVGGSVIDDDSRLTEIKNLLEKLEDLFEGASDDLGNVAKAINENTEAVIEQSEAMRDLVATINKLDGTMFEFRQDLR